MAPPAASCPGWASCPGDVPASAPFVPTCLPFASKRLVSANVTLVLTLNSRTALLPLMTTARSLASSDTLLVTPIVFESVIVPLQQKRMVPPRDIVWRNPASSHVSRTLPPEHALGMDNIAVWLVTFPEAFVTTTE